MSGPPVSGLPAKAPAKKWFYVPQRLIMPLAFALVGLVAAVSATGFFLYDRATEPDRSTPGIAVRQFLNAVFTEKDDTQIGLFLCSDWSTSDAKTRMNRGIGPNLSVAWGNFLDVSDNGHDAKVRVQIRLSANGSTSINRWEFVLVKESGWRVCGARDLGPLETRPG